MSLDLFNFSSDKANEPVDVVFVHPVTKEKTDLVISIVGLDSTAAQACLDKQQAKRFNELSKDGELKDVPFNPTENRGQLIELLVACTIGWRNLIWNGEELPFTAENAAMVYDKVPSIRELLNRETGNRKLFYKG